MLGWELETGREMLFLQQPLQFQWVTSSKLLWSSDCIAAAQPQVSAWPAAHCSASPQRLSSLTWLRQPPAFCSAVLLEGRGVAGSNVTACYSPGTATGLPVSTFTSNDISTHNKDANFI